MKKLLLVLGAALMATAQAEVLATSVALNEFHTGMTFGFGSPAGYFATPEAKAEVDRMYADGVRWVCLVVNVWSEAGDSPRQFADMTLTPADDELVAIIRHMHEQGIRVQLRPMLECFDGTTRAWIYIREDSTWIGKRFTKRSEWFRGLRERSVRYARLAERTGCELYCIDSELDRMTDCNAEWKSVVAAIRDVYHGPVTSCHTIWVTSPDKIEQHINDTTHWFHDLDLLSLSVYMGTGGKDRSVGEEGIREKLLKSQFSPARLAKWRKTYGKPIVFGEIGCAAQYAESAGGFDPNADYAPARQRDYLRAALYAYLESGAVSGFYWWQWLDSNKVMKIPTVVPMKDPRIGFSLKDKPAEVELKVLYSRLNATAAAGKGFIE